MGRIHSQKKGKRGEDDFCKWLAANLDIHVRREHFQASGHDADITGVDDFLFEVKRHETESLDNWWHQVIIAAKHGAHRDKIPVVAYRKNHQKWRFLVPAKLITGLSRGFLIMHETVFIQYAKTIIREQEEIESVECSGNCGEFGDVNCSDGRYYCGTGERCCP